MAPMVQILDLLDIIFDTKPDIGNKKEYGIKLILQALINHLNISDLHIEIKEEDSMFFQEIMHGTRSDLDDTSNFQKTVSNLQVFGCSVISTENSSSLEGKKDSSSDRSRTGTPVQKPEKPLKYNKEPDTNNVSQTTELEQEESGHDGDEYFINVYSTQNESASQASDYDVSEESPIEPTTEQSSIVEDAEQVTQPAVDRTSSGEEIEKSAPLDFSNKIPEAEVIEKICLDFLNNFSKDCEELKQVIDYVQELFGDDFIETMRLVRQAADLADNNRLRQIYFHEGIYKKISKSGPDEDFKPIRRGPREIIIRRAKDLAKDEEAKIGDLTMSKEEVIREEKLLPKLAELEDAPPKKAEEQPSRSFILPIMTPEDVTITKLNELIKEHEDIKCYIEYLIYHVNTLADFTEASIPIIYANDPSMEGLQQRMREIHLTPSEYIVTKKLQSEIKDFFETFIVTVGDFERRLTNQGSLLVRLDGELSEKTTNLKNAIEAVRTCLKNTAKKLNEKLDSKRESETMSEEKLIHFQEEVDKINKEQIFIFTENTKTTTKLNVLTCLLEKMKDDIFKLNADKLEKLELQKLLATKADCSLLNSKVSETQFSLAYNDLTSGLNSLWNQLGGQNFIWDMLVSICIEFQNKSVTRDDFERSYKFMTREIKKLKNTMIELKEKDEVEALGTKTKYIRNLQCVSCNRGGTMKATCGHPPFPALPKLPLTHGLKQDGFNKRGHRCDSGFTNRYVGGSHTIIKPKEKVLQHPEVIDVSF